MTEKQKKIIEDFINHHGDMKYIELGPMVQIQIGYRVSKDRGVSLESLNQLSDVFNNISFAVTTKTCEYLLYITMFTVGDSGEQLGL